MKKMRNLVTVSGYIYDFGSEKTGIAVRTSKKGVNYIGGDINIAIDKEGTNVIPVHFSYLTPVFSKAGTPNPNYNIMMGILNNGYTVIRDGLEKATFVTITGSVSTNDYIDPQTNTRRELKRIEGSRVKVERPGDMQAIFDGDLLINKVIRKEATEDNGMAEDIVEVSGCFWNFRNEMVPVVLECTDKGLMEGLESISDELPYAANVVGSINHARIVTKTVEQGLGGTNHVRNKVTFDNRWDLTYVDPKSYYGEGITEEEVVAATQAREIHWAEVEKQRAEYAASVASAAPAQAPAPANSVASVRAAAQAAAASMADF